MQKNQIYLLTLALLFFAKLIFISLTKNMLLKTNKQICFQKQILSTNQNQKK